MNQQTMGLNTRSLLLAGVIAGAAMGLLSHIPLVNCVNCLLMGWVWGGGIGAVYLYRQYENRPPLSATQGLLIGAAAGVIGALIGGVAAALFGGLGAAFSGLFNSLAGESGRGITDFFLSTGFSVLRVVGDVFLYGIVSAIGGLIAAALIWKTPAAPVPPYAPPPPGPVV